MARLAFFTFGIMREPWGHEQVRGFEERIEGAFETARGMPGFVAFPPVMSTESYHEPIAPDFAAGRPSAQTLSLWQDLESVHAYAYRTMHAEAIRLRKEWFVEPQWPSYAAWWVADDHDPDWEEAIARHRHLHDHGPTPGAFNFKTPFDAHGQPTRVDVAAQRISTP